MNQSDCLLCDAKKAHPCRLEGVFSPDLVANAALRSYELDENDQTYFWAHSCLTGLESEHPEIAWDIGLRMVRNLTTVQQASCVAAGTFEQLLVDYPEDFVPVAEKLALVSARFRYVLSGVWPQRLKHTDAWQRILAARAPGPNMDNGDPVPPNDLPD